MEWTQPCCAYQSPFHKGKVEWHHPISTAPSIGLYLCEAHHSLLQGRKVRYQGEMVIDKTVGEMRLEVKLLETATIRRQGHEAEEVDKH